MKKVEITTECGEVSTIYVSQDVEKIVIDGEEFRPEEKEEEVKNPSWMQINFKNDSWGGIVSYGTDLDKAMKLLSKFESEAYKGMSGTLIWLYSVDMDMLKDSI